VLLVERDDDGGRVVDEVPDGPADRVASEPDLMTRSRARRLFVLAVLVAVGHAAPATGQSPQTIAERAERAFAEGRVAESVTEFDRLVALVPSVGPTLWQRGIALYYLGRFDACAAQFRSFFETDPGDLENATWHVLCVARAESPDRARAAALEAGPDPRILRGQIYEMVRGRRSPESLVALAETSVPLVRFYAHLYVGLYADATGDAASAREHLTAAAGDDYRDLGGFMNVVARVFAARLAGAR
jgi:lipoprotein NlpI